ncbi:MAG: outer membrane protein assembly factor BamD [Bacteroidales bacterium]|jgi:Ca-activated chloride channel family protein|nr:outer membrane protein assembly factor BamD [Bacteroidales bacterium]
MKNILIILMITCLGFISCDKAKQYTRKANRKYNKKEYSSATKYYQKAIKSDSTYNVAQYNLANSSYKGKDYVKSLKFYNKYLEKKTGKTKEDSLNTANAYYNRGNTYFSLSQSASIKGSDKSSKLLQAAVKDYKNSLILNPKDKDSKYNLALCLWLLKNNNNSRSQQQNQPQNQPQPQQNQNQQQTQRMLDALNNNEKKTLRKVKEQKDKQNQRQTNDKDW